MKKTLFITMAAIAALTSCTKEFNKIEPQKPSGETVTIHTEFADVKTAFGDNMKSVVWEDTDKMSIIMQTGENLWGASAEFSKGAGDEFTGTFATPEDGPKETGTNTYFAFYPYDATITTIGLEKEGAKRYMYKGGDSKDGNYMYYFNTETQDGLNNMNHIHVPVYGTGTAEGKVTPDITMQHLAAIFKVSIKNPGTEPINVKHIKISNDGKVNMSGGFRLNISSDYPFMGSSSKSFPYMELNVINGEIAGGATGDFYIMAPRVRILKPEKAEDPVCTKITVETKTDKDFMIHEIPVDVNTAEVVFLPGLVHTTKIDYVKTGDIVPVEPIVFSALTPEQQGMNLKINATTEKFVFDTESSTPVGIWYSTDGGITKTEIAGTYKTSTSEIVGRTGMLEPGDYTIGVWASRNNNKEFSEGMAFTIIKQSPYKFMALTAASELNKVTVSCKLKNHDDDKYVESSVVESAGIWYSTDAGVTKTEQEIAYDGENYTIKGIFDNLKFDTLYSFGTYVVIGGEKWYSTNVDKTLTNSVNLNESTVDMSDKGKFHYSGSCKMTDITVKGTVYKGIRVGAVKNGEFKTGLIKLDNAQMKLTGNIVVEFYALAGEGDGELKVTMEAAGKVNGLDNTTVSIKTIQGYDGGDYDWIDKEPTAENRYRLELTGVTDKTMVILEPGNGNKIINMWGIRVEKGE